MDSVILLSSYGCLPCDRAKLEVNKVMKKYPQINIIIKERQNEPEYFKYLGIYYTPTLLVNEEAVLSGAHMVKEMEIVGTLKDMGILDC